MELWFILALLSTIAAGANSFLYKIAAKEKFDIVILSFYGAIVSSIILLVLTLLFSNVESVPSLVLLLSFVVTATYLMTTVGKVKALEYVDSTIFFPLYKVFGPAVVILVGLLFFGERFTPIEWIGLVLSLLIPFLLISKSENQRQIDLKMGLFFLGVVVIIGGFGNYAWKLGSDIAPNTWMYVLIVELFMIPISFGALYKKYKNNSLTVLKDVWDMNFMKMLTVIGVANAVAGSAIVFAFTAGGTLGIVHTINSLYILIPIVLSIIFYNEHWNKRKALAVILSIAALIFFA